ncbi:MAG: Na+/H+ antiporter NhaC family protein [Dongiaceae bacterium]
MATDQTSTRPLRQPSLLHALIPVAALIGLLAASYLLYGDGASAGPNQVALLFAAIVAIGVGYTNGYRMADVRKQVTDGIAIGLPAMLILLAVGGLIGTWAMGGTIVAMTYYGIQILSPEYFYVTTAIVCAVISSGIGSSWTTAATIGIGLMAISEVMGLSPTITAGAVISGAYFGDRLSPLSGSSSLATAAAGSELYEHVSSSLWTAVPSLLIALVIFFMLGEPGEFDLTALLTVVEEKAVVSPWALAPLVLLLVLAFARFPPAVAIFLSALAAGLVAVLLNGDAVLAFVGEPNLSTPLAMIKGVWTAIATGYVSDTGSGKLDQLLTRGGMESMLSTIWLIISALCFGSIFESMGLLERLTEPLIRRLRSIGAMVAGIVATCLGANILTSDQYIAIVLPGRIFKAHSDESGQSPVLLSRTLADAATVTSPLVPWNSCGAFMSATLGVPTFSYLPYCFFNLISPVMAVLAAYLRFHLPKRRPASVERTGSQE